MNKVNVIDTTHLDSLYMRLSHEKERFEKAKSDSEKEIRRVWVAQLEKEIEQEKQFLGIEDIRPDKVNCTLSDEDLLSELLG
jgi:hypothetical protein